MHTQLAERLILIIDDNPGDLRLLREILREIDVPCRLETAGSTVQAFDFLQRAGAPLPDLVLLDLHLPGQSGLQLLEQMKADPRLKRIPVAVASTSAAAPDIAAAYDRHANCYLVKPINLEDFMAKLRLVLEFWFSAVQLPKEEP